MVEQKEYLTKKIKTKINIAVYLGSTLIIDEKPYFHIHRMIFDDIRIICRMKMQSKQNQISNKYKFLKYLFDVSFYSFTNSYYNSYSIAYLNITLLCLQSDYLCFLVYLFNLINDDTKLEKFINSRPTVCLINNAIILRVNKSFHKENYNAKRDTKLLSHYFHYYLQHRKVFK